MAGIITYMAPVDRASGKILGKSQRWSAVNRDWGQMQRGCAARYKNRNYSTNPLSLDEKAARSAFKSAAEKRSTILANSSLRATWVASLKAEQKAGTTKCATLNGYIMHKGIKGLIDESNNLVQG